MRSLFDSRRGSRFHSVMLEFRIYIFVPKIHEADPEHRLGKLENFLILDLFFLNFVFLLKRPKCRTFDFSPFWEENFPTSGSATDRNRCKGFLRVALPSEFANVLRCNTPLCSYSKVTLTVDESIRRLEIKFVSFRAGTWVMYRNFT